MPHRPDKYPLILDFPRDWFPDITSELRAGNRLTNEEQAQRLQSLGFQPAETDILKNVDMDLFMSLCFGERYDPQSDFWKSASDLISWTWIADDLHIEPLSRKNPKNLARLTGFLLEIIQGRTPGDIPPEHKILLDSFRGLKDSISKAVEEHHPPWPGRAQKVFMDLFVEGAAKESSVTDIASWKSVRPFVAGALPVTLLLDSLPNTGVSEATWGDMCRAHLVAAEIIAIVNDLVSQHKEPDNRCNIMNIVLPTMGTPNDAYEAIRDAHSDAVKRLSMLATEIRDSQGAYDANARRQMLYLLQLTVGVCQWQLLAPRYSGTQAEIKINPV